MSNINVKVGAPVRTPVRFTTNATPIVIRNDVLVAQNKLKSLDDVVMLDPSDGNTLVYRSSDEKFILESPDNLHITNIDGGNF